MPKRIITFLIFSIALLSLLTVLSCGSGDTVAVDRINPIDALSGGTPDGGPGGGGGGGGGGGATGACVVSIACYQGIDLTSCEFLSGAFHAGQVCATYGFPNCGAPISGVSFCTPPL